MRTVCTLLGTLLVALLCAGVPWHGEAVEAGTAVRMSVADLATAAQLVVEGRVLSARPLESEGMIETEYLLRVERTFVGRDLDHRAIRIPGGVLADGRGLFLAGVPRLAPGEDVLLFLSGESRRGTRMPVGLAQGKYRVVARPDGKRALARDTRGVALIHPRSGARLPSDSYQVRDYAEVVAEIEAALARAWGEGR